MRPALHVAAVAGWLIATAQVTAAQDWTNAANYPARVQSITFPSGILDKTRSIQVGSWKIAFTEEVPIASWQPIDEKFRVGDRTFGFVSINISNQSCLNTVVGDVRCTFQIRMREDSANKRCGFRLIGKEMIEKVGYSLISTDCPKEIAFDR